MKTKKCYETHKHCNGPSCNYDKSASPSSLTPAQRRLSDRNNSRKEFEAVNGGKLPEPRMVKLTDQTVEHWEAVARANEAQERQALKPWENKP